MEAKIPVLVERSAGLGGGALIHFPQGEGDIALCGFAGPLERQLRPSHWAGVWCTACMRSAAGVSPTG